MGSSVSVVQAEALTWLAANATPEHTSAITSLPDQQELAHLSFSEWRAWFAGAARALLRWLPHDGTAIFYQRDVDASQLVLDAAAAESFALVWHKIVGGTAGFSQLVCVQRAARAPCRPLPDVLTVSWRRGLPIGVCQLAIDHLRHETATRCVIDPFCGRGNALAVAAAGGFDVIGLDLHARRSRATRSLLARTRRTLAAVQLGAALFEHGEYFEAHEAWEARWRLSHDADERLGLQGLIQVTAAFHKWFVMRAPESAQRLLSRGLQKLEATQWLPGISLRELLPGLRACAAAMATGELARAQVPRLML